MAVPATVSGHAGNGRSHRRGVGSSRSHPQQLREERGPCREGSPPRREERGQNQQVRLQIRGNTDSPGPVLAPSPCCCIGGQTKLRTPGPKSPRTRLKTGATGERRARLLTAVLLPPYGPGFWFGAAASKWAGVSDPAGSDDRSADGKAAEDRRIHRSDPVSGPSTEPGRRSGSASASTSAVAR